MRADNLFDILGGVVLVAMVTTVVTSRNAAGQITAAANGFSNIIASSLGKGSIRR
jgi:uncharacterized protein YejL (UPF0352 family)